MMKQQIYNLMDFAIGHHLQDIFGAYAAHVAFDDSQAESLSQMASERTLFTKVLLVKRGNVKMEVLQQSIEAGEGMCQLKPSDLLVVSPKHVVTFSEASPDFEAECILVDEEIAADTLLCRQAECLFALSFAYGEGNFWYHGQ